MCKKITDVLSIGIAFVSLIVAVIAFFVSLSALKVAKHTDKYGASEDRQDQQLQKLSTAVSQLTGLNLKGQEQIEKLTEAVIQLKSIDKKSQKEVVDLDFSVKEIKNRRFTDSIRDFQLLFTLRQTLRDALNRANSEIKRMKIDSTGRFSIAFTHQLQESLGRIQVPLSILLTNSALYSQQYALEEVEGFSRFIDELSIGAVGDDAFAFAVIDVLPDELIFWNYKGMRNDPGQRSDIRELLMILWGKIRKRAADPQFLAELAARPKT